MGEGGTMRYHVKDWQQFQHYRTRRPPWIKLHRELVLRNYRFAQLPLASKALAPFCWLLASESDDASISGDLEELAFLSGLTVEDVKAGLDGLCAARYLVASTALAECLQDARPERETEGEGERETETKAARKQASKPAETLRVGKPKARGAAPIIQVEKPADVSEESWAGFCAHRKARRATVTPRVISLILGQSEAAGWTLEAALDEMVARGWTGFKAEWVLRDRNGIAAGKPSRSFKDMDYGNNGQFEEEA